MKITDTNKRLERAEALLKVTYELLKICDESRCIPDAFFIYYRVRGSSECLLEDIRLWLEDGA